MINYKLLFLIVAITSIPIIASAETYCSPAGIMNETLDHNGIWYNFTITSEDCYVCVPNGAGYGDLECTECSLSAQFSTNITEGVAPISIQFTDLSVGNISNWNWSFGDGNYSDAQNPVHNYTTNGIYTVSLNISNGATSDNETKINYIVLSTAPPLHITVKANVGENKIDWSIRSISPANSTPPLNIYLDNNNLPSAINFTAEQILQPNLNPSERHTITIVNATAQYLGQNPTPVTATAKTLASSGEVYTILIVGIVVLLAIIIFRNLLFVLLASVFNIVLSIAGTQISQGYGVFPYMFIAIGIITAIFLLIIGIPKLKDQMSW